MKTIEEASKEYALSQHGKGFEGWPDFDYTIDDFKSGVEFAQRWIPVEEELPENQGHYLVIAPKSFPKNCEVMIAEFYEDNQTFYCEYSDFPLEDVTNWRPIEYK